ncbi:hypothetical protein, partial [Mesorhizobium sp.]|uniref:hypothetical protein n=2 Tax=Mesorhizobium sp. TaxID=1871066 RepID=UPI00257C2C69
VGGAAEEEEVAGEDSVEWLLQVSQATNSENSAAKWNHLASQECGLIKEIEPDSQFNLNVSRLRIRATI